MNVSSLLGEFDAHLAFRTARRATDDDVEMTVTISEAAAYGERGGMPIEGGDQTRVRSRLSARALHLDGSVANLVIEASRTTIGRAVQEHMLRRLMNRLDPIFFALDHEGGHGLLVEAGIRELWAAADPDTRARYAARREEALQWLAAFEDKPLKAARI